MREDIVNQTFEEIKKLVGDKHFALENKMMKSEKSEKFCKSKIEMMKLRLYILDIGSKVLTHQIVSDCLSQDEVGKIWEMIGKDTDMQNKCLTSYHCFKPFLAA